MKWNLIFRFLFLLVEVFGIIKNSIELPSIQPKISTGTAVPICPNSENKFQNILNDLFNSTVVQMVPQVEQIALCENSQIIAKYITEPHQGNCGVCDYSYIVLIKTIRNGNITTVCQGLFLPDCTIATIYECTQLGKGLWVTFPDGETFDVDCIQEAKEVISNNLLGNVFVVKLVIKAADRCKNLSKSFPKFATYSMPIINGFLIPRKCSSCDISWNPVPSILAAATLGTGDALSVEVKAAIPDHPELLCQPFYAGTPFIDINCFVHGIAFRRPLLALGIFLNLPLANTIDTTCAVSLVQPSFDSCN